jgi:general stress protein YciG
MAGTIEGGKKAAARNIARDPDFYSKIGTKGGKNGHTGGFAANRELARIAGKKGGHISKRRPRVDATIEHLQADALYQKLRKARAEQESVRGSKPRTTEEDVAFEASL